MDENIEDVLEIRERAGSPQPPDSSPVVPEKIGGWLYLPASGLVLGGMFSVVGILFSFGIASDLPSRYQGVFALNLLVNIGITAFVIFAAVRFFARSRKAPTTMIALIITNIVASAVLVIINLAADAEPFAVVYGKALVKGVIGAAIWIPYFRVSKRVKRTFVLE